MRIKISIVIIIAILTVVAYLFAGMNFDDMTEMPEKEDYPGEIFRLEPMTISPDIEQLSVKFILSRTLKFVDEAPPTVTIHSGDQTVIYVDSAENTDPKRAFIFPAKTKPGKTELTVDYRVFCCNSGPGAVCFFKEGRIMVPVTVADGGDEIFEIKHMIDE